MIFAAVYSAHSADRNRTQRESDTTIRGKSVDFVRWLFRRSTEGYPKTKIGARTLESGFAPRAGLTPRQAAVVRREYGFDGELLCVETRKTLEFYLDRRWRLDQPGVRLERSRTDYKHLDC
jgi:hypothetical protein